MENRFGSWNVEGEIFIKDGKKRVNCVCDCGTKRIVDWGRLIHGHTRSCGCKANGKTHGMSKTKTHIVWKSMRNRCNGPSQDSYHLYGGRGIRVCERWDSFENFLSDMGECPQGYSLDRINVNGNYEPDNCRWIPLKRQAHNTRRSRVLRFSGEDLTMADWSEKLGISTMLIWWRLNKGWSVDRALGTPVRSHIPYSEWNKRSFPRGHTPDGGIRE